VDGALVADGALVEDHPRFGEDLYHLPQCVAGREGITRDAVQALLSGTSWILTGVGGMGKTTVAAACLRHPAIQLRFQNR
jgi:MoxR-like ATPase